MAKRYEIRLSPVGKSFDWHYVDVRTGMDHVASKDYREVELAMLTGFLELAANETKDLRKINVCYDLIGQIENLSDNNNVIIIDDSDRENLKIGLEKSVGRRPQIWSKARDLWTQLETPKVAEDK